MFCTQKTYTILCLIAEPVNLYTKEFEDDDGVFFGLQVYEATEPYFVVKNQSSFAPLGNSSMSSVVLTSIEFRMLLAQLPDFIEYLRVLKQNRSAKVAYRHVVGDFYVNSVRTKRGLMLILFKGVYDSVNNELTRGCFNQVAMCDADIYFLMSLAENVWKKVMGQPLEESTLCSHSDRESKISCKVCTALHLRV